MTLRLNDQAPDFDAVLVGGESINLKAELEKGPICLIFLRYIGCPVCRQRLSEIEDELGQYQKQNLGLIVVLESPVDRVEDYYSKKGLNIRTLPDAGRKLYDLYDVSKGGIASMLNPGVLKSAAKATLQGHMHGALGGSEMQLPAAFIVGKDGKLAYVNYGKHGADTPSTDTLLANAPSQESQQTSTPASV